MLEPQQLATVMKSVDDTAASRYVRAVASSRRTGVTDRGTNLLSWADRNGAFGFVLKLREHKQKEH